MLQHADNIIVASNEDRCGVRWRFVLFCGGGLSIFRFMLVMGDGDEGFLSARKKGTMKGWKHLILATSHKNG